MSTALLPAKAEAAKSELRTLLTQLKPEIAAALPKHLTPERMTRIAMTALSRNPKLFECTKLSILASIMTMSQLGWECDPVLQHCYLVPFRNRKTGETECQLIPGYQGVLDLVRRSGQVESVSVEVVREKDRFHFSKGLTPTLTHEPYQHSDAGQAIAYYAVVRLKGGGVQWDVMWRAQVEQHRDRFSKSAKEGPWVDDFDAMALKTVLKRVLKYCPKSTELRLVETIDYRVDADDPVDAEGMFEAPRTTLDALADQLTPKDQKALPREPGADDALFENRPESNAFHKGA